MSTPATPLALPWRIEYFERNNGDEKGVQIKDANDKVICHNEAYYPLGVDRHDAKIIVDAVNDHLEIESLKRDAALWRKHKESFAVLQRILDAATPTVLNRLKAEDAAKAAGES